SIVNTVSSRSPTRGRQGLSRRFGACDDRDRSSLRHRRHFVSPRGRSCRPIVRIIPEGILYRIEWPDIGLSDLTNLTRAKAAALEWAERQALTEDRKTSVARRLKSLDNSWWSSSYSAPNEQAAA